MRMAARSLTTLTQAAAVMTTTLAPMTSIAVAISARNHPVAKPIMPTPKPVNMMDVGSKTPTVTTSRPGPMIRTGAVKCSMPHPKPMLDHLHNRKPNGMCGFARRSTSRRRRPEACLDSSRPSSSSARKRNTTGARSCAGSSILAKERITHGRGRTVGFSRPD